MTINLHRWDAEAVQMSLWDGLTRNGNLTHLAIRHIENALAEVTRTQQCLRGMEAQISQLTRAQEHALRRCWLLLGDLRYMREPCTGGELQQRARAWRAQHAGSDEPACSRRSHVHYTGPERRRRGERRRRRSQQP